MVNRIAQLCSLPAASPVNLQQIWRLFVHFECDLLYLQRHCSADDDSWHVTPWKLVEKSRDCLKTPTKQAAPFKFDSVISVIFLINILRHLLSSYPLGTENVDGVSDEPSVCYSFDGKCLSLLGYFVLQAAVDRLLTFFVLIFNLGDVNNADSKDKTMRTMWFFPLQLITLKHSIVYGILYIIIEQTLQLIWFEEVIRTIRAPLGTMNIFTTVTVHICSFLNDYSSRVSC